MLVFGRVKETPWKINMEPENDGLEDDFPFQSYRWFWGSMLIFRGETFLQTSSGLLCPKRVHLVRLKIRRQVLQGPNKGDHSLVKAMTGNSMKPMLFIENQKQTSKFTISSKKIDFVLKLMIFLLKHIDCWEHLRISFFPGRFWSHSSTSIFSVTFKAPLMPRGFRKATGLFGIPKKKKRPKSNPHSGFFSKKLLRNEICKGITNS